MIGIADLEYMRRALRLASLGRHASPNPMVGAVVVDRNGVKVGEGYHPSPGQPHAEIFALRQAGSQASGATIYVTLEPCSHHGRTPPCTDAIIAAGIAHVVAAMPDPDSRVSGRGLKRLGDAGIAVTLGALQSEASRLNAAYVHQRSTGMPWLTVKVATTLDGKTATVAGDSKWITSPTTRSWVHRQLRDRCDAIMVGLRTVLHDDPSLTTRLMNKTGRNPLRLVLDSHLRTPLESKIVRQSGVDGKTVICCLARNPQGKKQEFSSKGVELICVSPDADGRPSLSELMLVLGTRGDVVSVLLEGGSTLIASALELGLVNRYIATIAPKIVGGKSAPGAVGGDGISSTMQYATSLKSWRVRRSAADLVIDAHLND